jgi:hypothetical protein
MPITIVEVDATAKSGTYTTVEADTFFGRTIDGAMQLILPDVDKCCTSREGFAGTVAIATGTAIASSMYARKRQAAGAEPLLKILF